MLVVDDEAFMRNLLRRLLERLGCIPTLVATAAEGLAITDAQVRPPDLILSDIELPDVNGYEFVRRVRERHPAVRVAVMSGNPPPVASASSLAAPVLLYLQKPFNAESLARLLEDLMAAPPAGGAGDL